MFVVCVESYSNFVVCVLMLSKPVQTESWKYFLFLEGAMLGAKRVSQKLSQNESCLNFIGYNISFSMAFLTKNLFRLRMPSLLRRRTSARNPNFTLFSSSNNPSLAYHSNHHWSYSHRSNVDSKTHMVANQHSVNHELVGWWVGVSEQGKDPYGQLVHISAEQGRYLARSYSPWQLAKAKNGTPVFEIYVTTGLDGQRKEQAIYLVDSEDPFGSSRSMRIAVRMFHLRETSREQWAEALTKFAASNGGNTNKETYMDIMEEFGIHKGVKCNQENEVLADSLQEKVVFCCVFNVGDMVPKVSRTRDKKLLRVPATMERKGGFSFCLILEEDKVLHLSSDHCHRVYGTKDKGIFDALDCVGRGIYREGNLKDPLPTIQQPILSCFTTYKRIDVPASSDPLEGLYIGSNGSFATEVIQLRRLFGPWHEVGGIKDVSNIETCEFVEAVNLSGNCNMPAGQVAFRARIGEEFKVSPWTYLEEEFGATARYKGEGRLSGFQNSELVNVEILILGKEYYREGFEIGVLYSAPKYYILKLYKKNYLDCISDVKKICECGRSNRTAI